MKLVIKRSIQKIMSPVRSWRRRRNPAVTIFTFCLAVCVGLLLFNIFRYRTPFSYAAQFVAVEMMESPDGKLPISWPKVAIGCAVSMRNVANIPSSPIMMQLVPSFCKTATDDVHYHFYVSHDYNDPLLSGSAQQEEFTKYFDAFVSKNCRDTFSVELHLIQCNHYGNPAWAQNDAMIEAYLDDMTYFYRVNDDTLLDGPGWTEAFIQILLHFDPLNVGVVGPKTVALKGGSDFILTYDFVHRTHIDIFGFYYPRLFRNWFADDWISHVYQPARSMKLKDVQVTHTQNTGVKNGRQVLMRYNVTYQSVEMLDAQLDRDKFTLLSWLKAHGHLKLFKKQVEEGKVISYSITGSDLNTTMGAVRNTILHNQYFPEWKLRFYIEDQNSQLGYEKVPERTINLIKKYGAEIHYVEPEVVQTLAPAFWKYLVADDPNVEYFLIRDVLGRLNQRDAQAVSAWINSEKSFHCIRDHPDHAKQVLQPGLIGGKAPELRKTLKDSWKKMMQEYTPYDSPERNFLNQVIWSQVKGDAICHDSIGCDSLPEASPFPGYRREGEFIGQKYGASEVLDEKDVTALANHVDPLACYDASQTLDNQTLELKKKVVLWNQDFHISPIQDVKHILQPLGVRIIDKSLSGHCEKVGTCAQGLKVITKGNGMSLPSNVAEEFYEAYKDDEEFKRVDAFLCMYPVAMCEAYMKFNKPLIIIAVTRYEQGRLEQDRWVALNTNLKEIAQNKKNVIAANNRYDQKYIQHFTGIRPVLIPSMCSYVPGKYFPTKKEFLLDQIFKEGFQDYFLRLFLDASLKATSKIQLLPLREVYKEYTYLNLASHPGIVHIPYQVSTYSICEQYRMNIPLFFPSLDLLSRWHAQYNVVNQRTWKSVLNKIEQKSSIKGVIREHDPNNDKDEFAIRDWLALADFYEWPHIIYFESADDLVKKMQTTDLQAVSRKMQEHNAKAMQKVNHRWTEVIKKVIDN